MGGAGGGGGPRVGLAMSRELLAQGGTAEDRLVGAGLERRGIAVEAVAWNAGVPSGFDGVLLRSCWDYHLRPADFRVWLRRLEADGLAVVNPVPLVVWNMDKRYLSDLAARGVRVVPTRVCETVTAGDLDDLQTALGRSELVVKPVVGATAFGWRLLRSPADLPAGGLGEAGGPWLVQPLVDEVSSEGEHSLVFFGGVASHGVLKMPAAGDYRVQTEFGGRAERRKLDAELVAFGGEVLAALDVVPAYARVDVVRHRGEPCLMELEVIEPQLFLAEDDPGLERLIDAVVAGLGLGG